MSPHAINSAGEIHGEHFGSDTSFPIAIVGMSCKFSGDATSPETLWELCEQGRSGWSEIPSSRFNSKAFLDGDHEKVGMVCVLEPMLLRLIDTS